MKPDTFFPGLIHTLISLISELEWDEEPDQPKTASGLGALHAFYQDRQNGRPVERTLEERRVYLGAFWLGSM